MAIDLNKYKLQDTTSDGVISNGIDLSKYKLNPEPTITPEQTQGLGTRLLNTTGRLIGGTVGMVGDVADFASNAIMHPIDTTKNIVESVGRAGAGGIQELPGIKQWYDQNITSAKGIEQLNKNRQTFDALKGYLTSRYGGWDNIKHTAEYDPAGFLLDVSTVLDIGGSLGIKAGELNKLEKLTNASKVVKNVSETINPLTALTKSVGVGASKIGGKIQAPFAESFNPELAQKFQEAGITPPVSAVTNSKLLKAAESMASKGIYGEDIYKNLTKATDEVLAKQDEIVSHIKPERIITDESLGKNIQTGLNDYNTNFKATQNKVYDSFSQKVGDIPAKTKQTQSILKTLVTEQGSDLFSRPDMRFGKMLDSLMTGVYKEKSVGFNELKITRSAIGEELAKTGDPALKRLYGALTEDMNATVNSADKNFGKELNKINENYKNGINKIESNISQSILRSSPENIANNLLNHNSADMLKQLHTMIGEDRFNGLRDKFLQNTIENSYSRGQFDVTKFEKNLNAYDRPVLETLLTDKQMQTLDEAIHELNSNKELQTALKSADKIREGSQTAYLQKLGLTKSAPVAIATALFTGHPAIALGILSDVALDYGMAKSFTTMAGRKWLTEGQNFSAPIKSFFQTTAPRAGRAAELNNVLNNPNGGQPTTGQ